MDDAAESPSNRGRPPSAAARSATADGATPPSHPGAHSPDPPDATDPTPYRDAADPAARRVPVSASSIGGTATDGPGGPGAAPRAARRAAAAPRESKNSTTRTPGAPGASMTVRTSP